MPISENIVGVKMEILISQRDSRPKHFGRTSRTDSEGKTYKTQRQRSRGSGCFTSAILCTLRIALFLLTSAEVLQVPLSRLLTGDGMKRTWWIRDENGSHINKTLRFCRRCIDVVFILSSLMSTCELDRFVIQTPYVKVLKSCSAPFVDRAGIDNSDIDGRTNKQTE